MMKIQATRAGGIAETPAHPRLQGRTEAEQPLHSGKKSSFRAPDVTKLDRWALMSVAQQRIAHAQGGEQALNRIWGELKRVEQQLSQRSVAGSDIASRLKQMEAQLIQPQGPLTAELKPRLLASASESRINYSADQLDLLSPRNGSERLVFSFPQSGSAVEVQLPAGASQKEAVGRLDQALRKEHIQARLNELGKLELSIADNQRRKLDEPVLISGEGIRIPAGNPVPIQFKAAAGQLTRLGEGISQGELRQERQRLQRMLAEIEHSVRDLKQFRQKMVKQLAQVKARTQSANPAELEQIQSLLASQLREGGFAGTMSGLLAQANVSRQNVVALLS
ncbi:hypothetical protein ACTG23_06235 [Aeromonas enteropelogenes]|uniref:hypothetical protein n=1 Tax=Aeromonas enteropelogenes TaxID=29489 RepID=UPI003F797A7F